jgi:hypothetical protein
VNIKRLAAIAMYGSWGTLRPKQLVQAEFTAALAVTVALGIWLAIEASGLGTLILGIRLIGAGANYAPLAPYTILLGGPGALEAELADVDTGQELRRYGVRQGNSRGRPGTDIRHALPRGGVAAAALTQM